MSRVQVEGENTGIFRRHDMAILDAKVVKRELFRKWHITTVLDCVHVNLLLIFDMIETVQS